ncbi:MAG: DUF7467 domain-containing protein, partial [Gammaproteobacteria bacterium]
NGDVIDSTVTATDGSYLFDGLTPGDYSVAFIAPDGFGFTDLNAGDDTLDSDADPAMGGMTDTVTLTSGEFNDTLDAGLVRAGVIDIEKLVRIETPGEFFTGAVCDAFGDPVEMTFAYDPGLNVDTSQDSSKAAILFDSGAIDDDGTSWVEVTKESDPYQGTNLHYAGNVSFGETFIASEAFDNVSFGSSTYIHFYDDEGGALLQSLTYHTSCSQPIFLGDVVGNATLVGYAGQDGTAPTAPPIVGDDFDADSPSGPVGIIGQDTAVFTYVVTNPGTTAISDVVVTDDRLSDVTFVEGDTDGDGLLDTDETWIYTASEDVAGGLQTNVGTVTGKDPNGTPVTDDDPANYTGVAALPAIDIEKYVRPADYTPSLGLLCETLGDPLSLTFEYQPGTDVVTDQDSSKAAILFDSGAIDDDGTSWVVVTKESDPDKFTNLHFAGNVAFGETFTASEAFDNVSFGSSTYVHFYDDEGGTLLQSLTYHTSCSQPIQFGDVVGNVELVGYEGTDGGVDPSVLLGEDADLPNGPEAQFNTEVEFTYVVTNTGGTALGNVSVTDDRLTDVTFVDGDTDGDGLLDTDETWIYTASETALVGQVTNTGTVVGTAVDDDGNDLLLPEVSDSDDANYIVVGGPAIDIEKYVRPADYTPSLGLLCETLGDPLSLTFEYQPGTDVVTDQDSSKAAILFDSGAIDDDGTSWVVVTKESDPDKFTNLHFAGNVAFGETFTASEAFDNVSFGSSTYVHFYDDEGGTLLQSLTYHTSCSQPIQFGDVVGNVELVGYEGTDGGVDPAVLLGEDADDAPGIEVLAGDSVEFTYIVTNPGTTALADVVLTDDRLTDVMFEGGDTNGDGLLDTDETWIYSASETAADGLVTNTGTVAATAVGVVDADGNPIEVSDADDANYTGVDELTPTYEVCETLGKPLALELAYRPSSEVDTSQGDKAEILFDSGLVDDDGISFVRVSDKSGADDTGGKQYFNGNVAFGEEFIASAAEAGASSFGSTTYVHIFDDEGGELLQTMEYHTSCSQPIYLGDEIGSVTLVGYQGEVDSYGIA